MSDLATLRPQHKPLDPEGQRLDRDFIEWRLEELGLLKGQVASYMQISPGQLSRLLAGTRNISPAQLDLLRRALGIDRRHAHLLLAGQGKAA